MTDREEIQRRVDEARADFLGRRVREVWVEWASRQPNPKPSHLTPWDQLDEGNREVDRLIGIELAKIGRSEADNAITWFTTCFNCSTLMDGAYAETVRAEKAEAALAEAERRHEALLTQAEDYLREISEAREQERAALADMVTLAGELVGAYYGPREGFGWGPVSVERRARLERARAVLGETENEDG